MSWVQTLISRTSITIVITIPKRVPARVTWCVWKRRMLKLAIPGCISRPTNVSGWRSRRNTRGKRSAKWRQGPISRLLKIFMIPENGSRTRSGSLVKQRSKSKTKYMVDFKIPARRESSPENQQLFDNLEKKLGFVPNQYAALANSEGALEGFLKLQDVRTSFGKREKLVVNLVVSQVNESDYCVAQHTQEAQDFELSKSEIDEIKSGRTSLDPKLDALARLTKELAENKGKPSREALEAFYKAGYNYGHVVDLTVAIGEKTIANYVCN